MGFCRMWRHGGLFRCNEGGGGGGAYANEFSGAGGEQRASIHGRATDGGFAHDPRDPSYKVDEAVKNISSRISTLNAAVPGGVAALPAWRTGNSQALAARSLHQSNAAPREAAERDVFAKAMPLSDLFAFMDVRSQGGACSGIAA